jgi:hypothetical protein
MAGAVELHLQGGNLALEGVTVLAGKRLEHQGLSKIYDLPR